jgi:hypothetical protein
MVVNPYMPLLLAAVVVVEKVCRWRTRDLVVDLVGAATRLGMGGIGRETPEPRVTPQ